MRQLTLIIGISIAVIAMTSSIKTTPKPEKIQQNPHIDSGKQAKDYKTAQEFLENQEPEEALEIIHRYKTEMESLSPQGLKWIELFIQGSVDIKDVKQLVILYEFFPEIFKEHEDASLLVADAYLNTNNTKNYKKIRSLWTDRETKAASWFLLDVDLTLLEGKRPEAIGKLKSRTFNNKADVGRLVRLALLEGGEDPKKAWFYLAEAYGKDPFNPDVRSYRAKLLESVGKHSLAQKEYQAASQISPSNLFLKDQLADFYLRHQQYAMALELMQANLAPPSLDSLWVKTLFWSKITTPLDFDWTDAPIPDGNMNTLIRYLISLDQDQFWDQKVYTRVANGNDFLKTCQETFWLRVLQELRDKNEVEAYKLLRYNPFTITSWHPHLEVALKRVANYRKNKTLKLEASQMPHNELPQRFPETAYPKFFEELEQLAESGKEVPQPLHHLLMGKEAYTAVFLAAGWLEAGLALHVLPIIPNDYPDWLAFAITQALYHNRSGLEAREFAALQKKTPKLQLLLAEITIAGGDKEAALKELLPLAKEDSDTGYRAAWLASLIDIEKQEYEKARTIIGSQPRLVNDVLGQETLARIAHLEGDQYLANRIYKSIEKKSPEARSYLARKAFQEQNWERARALTEQLIIDYPENPTLQENLKKIREKQKIGKDSSIH
ncbi:putative uncharacterized protein [Waddlia chondrophila 2032/99]|uniref:Tetratricopeptide repeat protein n=2 Tax=Waddlia chondrophila TaxID=71667 RepID=D6YTT2_WADCW|nr:hypothetical protein [Waddlia chondrophila]ADI37543.1 hypothetical protein wcw_0168 [Waddlia chondrophila WSU 86-1044]CCB91797.1 putative uncharacterized protein [Waddlia chondrophila 2032/99]